MHSRPQFLNDVLKTLENAKNAMGDMVQNTKKSVDNVVENTRNAIDNRIITTAESLQNAIDGAQGGMDKYVSRAQQWTNKTKIEVHKSIKSIVERVSYRDLVFNTENCSTAYSTYPKNL